MKYEITICRHDEEDNNQVLLWLDTKDDVLVIDVLSSICEVLLNDRHD